jgi:hypothetical protein
MQTYQLEITLDGIKPPIWRKLLVPSGITLDILHAVLQTVMGWEDSHPHEFSASKSPYTPLEKETGVRLDTVLGKEGDNLRYIYDFGDHWQHTIKLEKVLPLTDDFPKCVDGERACPPEDCGGIPGYEQILHAMRNPDDTDSEDLFEWVGEEFDPDYFNSDLINEALADFVVVPAISATSKLRIVQEDVAALVPDEDKIDDAVLALLTLTFHAENNVVKAWKTFDWDAMNRLYVKGYILDPVGKLKSVVLTEKGVAHAQQLFSRLFIK